MSPTSSARNALIAKIHCAKRDLGLDEVAYRMALRSATRGTESLTAMTDRQLELVIDFFRSKGWKPKPGKEAKRSVLDDRPMSRKIRAIWFRLHELGAIKSRSERSLAAWVKRMTGDKEDLRFVENDKLWLLVEAMKKWLSRAEAGNLKEPAMTLQTTITDGLKITKIAEAK